MAHEVLNGPGKKSDDAGRPVALQLINKEGYDAARVIRMRCPACRLTTRLETMDLPGQDYAVELHDGTPVAAGVRHCPNEACGQLIFVAYDRQDPGSSLLFTAPAETLDFDTTDLPPSVEHALSEAAVCFSNGCYTAAAIMIRKTLEEVCHDRQIPSGGNLKKRIEALSENVILPPELVAGLDSLRLLGNDAAHIESQTFNQVGRAEVQVSFEVVKEILKGVYQYGALIASLNSLKKDQR